MANTTETILDARDPDTDELAFEQRDARLGWWAALDLGLAVGVLLGAWLATR